MGVMLLLGLALSGCASLRLSQQEHEAIVRVGSEIVTERERADVAPYFVDYAVLSLLAYEDSRYGLKTRDAARDPTRDVEGRVVPLAQKRLAGVLGRWALLKAYLNECPPDQKGRRDFGAGGQPGSCASATAPKGRILDGLGVQAWRALSPGGSCPEIVFSFRGTDAKELDDWLTNLRWFVVYPKFYDQYDQVREHLARIVAAAKRHPCYRPGQTRLVAVGHSLGGGLAQQAAYAHPEIKRVYAFDPSPVTGYFDLPAEVARADSQGLRIDRVYEHGEFLAYLRLVMRHLHPLSDCDPQIRHVRLQSIHGGTIFSRQHSIALMTHALLTNIPDRLAPVPRAEARLPAAPAADAQGRCLYPPPYSTLAGTGTDDARPVFVLSYRRD